MMIMNQNYLMFNKVVLQHLFQLTIRLAPDDSLPPLATRHVVCARPARTCHHVLGFSTTLYKLHVQKMFIYR